MTTFITDEGVEVEYFIPDHIQFVQDMEIHEIPWRHYRGRFWWEGPAAVTSEDRCISSEDILRATTVALQHDGMGLGLIMYPVAS